MAQLAPTEIAALAGILGELNYYQLLHLEADAKPSDIKRAYHATSRTFHPDVNRHQDPEIRRAIDEIAKRVAEAYSILRNPRRRKAYDQQIEVRVGALTSILEPLLIVVMGAVVGGIAFAILMPLLQLNEMIQ